MFFIGKIVSAYNESNDMVPEYYIIRYVPYKIRLASIGSGFKLNGMTIP